MDRVVRLEVMSSQPSSQMEDTGSGSWQPCVTTEVTVPTSQVKMFLGTLKGYTNQCVESGASLQQILEDARVMVEFQKKQQEFFEVRVKNENESSEARKKKMVTDMKNLHEDILSVQEKQVVDMGTLRKELKRLDTVAKVAGNAGANGASIWRTMERVENKEAFVCTFVDIVKQSVEMSRVLYTRTVYASTICREVASSALNALECTMRPLQSINGRVKDTGSTYDDMTDGISVNNSNSGTEAVLKDILFKTRYLQTDMHKLLNMDQAAKLMDDVRLLDTSLRVAAGEIQ